LVLGLSKTSVGDAPLEIICLWCFARP